jgi:hypothetical protein
MMNEQGADKVFAGPIAEICDIQAHVIGVEA